MITELYLHALEHVVLADLVVGVLLDEEGVEEKGEEEREREARCGVRAGGY